MCDMTHSRVRHDSFICAIWLIRMCDMTHLYVRHDSFMCATWLIHLSQVRSREYTNVAWLISYVQHVSFTCATWLIHMCDVTHLYVRHDSSTSVGHTHGRTRSWNRAPSRRRWRHTQQGAPKHAHAPVTTPVTWITIHGGKIKVPTSVARNVLIHIKSLWIYNAELCLYCASWRGTDFIQV